LGLQTREENHKNALSKLEEDKEKDKQDAIAAAKVSIHSKFVELMIGGNA